MSITLKAGERMRVMTPAGEVTIEWTRNGEFRVSATEDVKVIRSTITRYVITGKKS